MVNVVFHTAFVGDLLLAIPLLKQIKKEYPSIPLVLISSKGTSSFFKFNKLVDDVYELDKKNKNSIESLYLFLKTKKIRYLFCPHQSFRSAWILRQVRAECKISYKNWWNIFFFNSRVERKNFLPEPLRLIDLLSEVNPNSKKQINYYCLNKNYFNENSKKSVFNWNNTITRDINLYINPDVELRQALQNRLHVQKPYVIIAPSSQWQTKKWTDNGFVELALDLSSKGLQVYFVGSESEAAHCQKLQNLATSSKDKVNVRTLAGETNLIELHALMSEAEVIIANDSGPMHMGAAAGRPVVGIFGPTTLNLGYRPWANDAIVIQTELSCRPCGVHGHNSCPIKTHDCMKLISASEVLQAVIVSLKNKEKNN